MSEPRGLSPKDWERLSAFVDGRLTQAETARLEQELNHQAALRLALQDLRWTRDALRSLPPLTVPRSFALKPEMAGGREPARWYPTLQLATALAAAAFVIVVGLDAFGAPQALRTDQLASGQAPAAESPAETGLELFAAEIEGTPTPQATPAAEDRLAPQATLLAPAMPALSATPCPTAGKVSPTEMAETEPLLRSGEDAQQEGEVQTSAARPPLSPLRLAEIGLGTLTIGLGVLTFQMRRRRAPR
ncbi:MAG TPA: hypothetical protein VFI11_04760 [Anaerolineales bacterium]|nr:hypothetical protein [Anaerolineales bacterium]